MDHPQRDNVDLVGILAFPNLQLETNMINFGSILNETSKKIIITMKNISEMPLNYEWNFVED
jgi:hydrocephalus-inducing protein